MFTPAFLALVNYSMTIPPLPTGVPLAPDALPVDIPALTRVVAAYAGYVRCTSRGAAVRSTCLSGQFFNTFSQACEQSGLAQAIIVVAARRAAAALADAATSCRSLECACDGRPDGLYPNPANALTAVVCSGGVAKVYECPKGAVFGKTDDGKQACTPLAAVKRARPTSLRSGAGMEGTVAASPAPDQQQPPAGISGTAADAGGAAP